MKTALNISLMLMVAVGCQSQEKTIKPTRKNIIESVYASSKILAKDQYEHRIQATGRLIDYLVDEGDEVDAGDIIAKLKGVEAKVNLQNAQIQLQNALSNRKQLDELALQLETAKARFLQDSINYSRQKRLFSNGIGSMSQLEQVEFQLASSRNQFRALGKRFSYNEDQVSSAIRQAQLNIDLAKENSSHFVVTALRKGRVYRLPAKIGELVSPQQVFALIGDENSFIVEMEIDERDIPKIKEGLKVIVKMDAYPDTYEAVISKIIPTLDPKTQTFKAEATFKSSHPDLYPGLAAESNIVLNTRDNVLVIPRNTIDEENQVITVQGLKKVKTGISNSEWVEVLSGIAEGDEIIVPE